MTTLSQLKDEIAKLQTRIVDNPERLKARIAEMSNTLTTEKSNIVNLEKKMRDLQARLDALEVVESELLPCIKGLQDCEDEMKRRDEVLKKVQEDTERVDRKNAVLRDLTMKETVRPV
jgi:kinetochore protein Nuf2